jgi:hypothetical protein
VKIRIIPGPHASDQHKKFIEAFQIEMPSGIKFREQFVDILKKVSEAPPSSRFISGNSL